MRKIVALGVIAIIIFAAILTNPTKEEYVSYTKEQKIKNSGNILEKSVHTFFTSSMMDVSTTTKNYALFSIFETEISNDETIKVIGIFNNFIYLDSLEDILSESN